MARRAADLVLSEILAGAEAEEDGEDSVGGEEADSGGRLEADVVFSSRPLGLELCPASPTGLGAFVKSVTGGAAAAAGMSPGTAILSLDNQSVEEMPTAEIQGRLDEVPLPVTIRVKIPLNLPGARKTTNRRRDPVTVCTAHCRGSYRAVQEALALLGWREVPGDSREASVAWLEHGDSSEGLAPVQTVSRLDAFLPMCRKAPLARCLNLWMAELPDDFSFLPETWVLPEDAADLESAMSRDKATYIAKPSAGTQGKGIVLAKKWSDLSEVVNKSRGAGDSSLASEYVVQKYIAQPLLLDGLKFDARIYAVVTSIVPMRAYLFKEGLARFCTVPYQEPKEGNLQDARMHLTNFAVNKQSKDFQTSEGVDSHDEGSKRSVSSVLFQIEQAHGVSADEMWQRIAKLTANTLMAMRPGLLEYHVQNQRRRLLHPLAPKGFQIIGLDVLWNSELEPQLLELNANPSLSVLQPGRGSDAAHPADVADALAAREAPVQSPAAGSALQAARVVRDGGSDYSGRQEEDSGPPPPSRGRDNPDPRRSLSSQSKQRLGRSSSKTAPGKPKGTMMVTSPIDLEIKRELIAQALLLARPAPQSKVARLRKQWAADPLSPLDVSPLADDGDWWAQNDIPADARPEVRSDAPGRCPALEVLDTEELVLPDVAEYAQAHLALYRIWLRGCGASQDSMGQAQLMKLLERRGFVGPGMLFSDRVAAQLWLSKTWRVAAEGAFGLDFVQFVCVCGRLGDLLAGDGAGRDATATGPSISGLLEFMRRAGVE